MWKSAIALGALLSACRGSPDEASRPPAGSSAGSGSDLIEAARAQIIATAAEAVGTVEVRRQGEVRWERVAVGATFRERDWVRTSKGGFVRLRFSTHGFVDLNEDTTLLVDTAITVQTGSVVATTAGEQPLRLKTADGSEVQIDGEPGAPAELRLTAAGDGVEVAVTKGNAKVTTKSGTVTVAAGQLTSVTQQRASDPMKLLGYPTSTSPGIDARFLFANDLKIALAWKPVAGAKTYFVELARDTAFHTLVMTAELTGQTTSVTPTSEGVYAWRVAARDAAGHLGEFGFARRLYCENDEPRDLLVGPRDATKLEFPNTPPDVEFSWQPRGEGQTYKLVVHSGVIGLDPPVEMTTTAQRATLKLDVGSYTWGVYVIKDEREEPIFLSMRQLTVAKQQGPKIHTEVQWNAPKH